MAQSLKRPDKIFELHQNKESLKAIYFTGYDSDDEEFDLFYTLLSWVNYGIDELNINVFAPPNLHSLKSVFINVTFYSPLDLHLLSKVVSGEHVITVVAGHGADYGVGYDYQLANQRITGLYKPFEFIQYIDQIQNLKLCMLFVVPCYAGVFNFWDTYSKNYCLVIVGSTGLNTAIADRINVPGLKKDVVGNIFLYYVADWLIHKNSSRDIDGDGHSTLIDCFKYAGANTGRHLIVSRGETFKAIQELYIKIKDPATPPHLEQVYNDSLNTRLKIFLAHQEPWVLNSNQMRQIYFS